MKLTIHLYDSIVYIDEEASYLEKFYEDYFVLRQSKNASVIVSVVH